MAKVARIALIHCPRTVAIFTSSAHHADLTAHLPDADSALRARPVRLSPAVPPTNSTNVVATKSRPPLMTTMSSQMSSISDMRWLDRSTVRPAPARDAQHHTQPSDRRGIETVVRLIEDDDRGSPIRAVARPNRCCMPSDMRPTGTSAIPVIPASSSAHCTELRGNPLLAADHPRDAHAPCGGDDSASGVRWAPTTCRGRR